ncbi:UmoD family flagellar biogenesis regulator [Providencia sp. Me31A]|uniref:UmoD family flagellar biogenesis regulator n=1 Tax=Providencia sp. Me31A TaxID=3392637 RepID=UPI003D2AE491
MKLKFKLLLAIIVAFFIAFLFMLFTPKPNESLATVLSVEPIKSNRLVEYQNCSVTGVLGTFNQQSLSRFHPAQNECKMFFMLEALQGKSFPSLFDDHNKTCVSTQKMELVTVGYDVIYQIGKTVGKVRTSYAPSMFIPLNEKGQLVLTSSNSVCETIRRDVKELLPFYCLQQNDLPLSGRSSGILEVQASQNTFGFME